MKNPLSFDDPRCQNTCSQGEIQMQVLYTNTWKFTPVMQCYVNCAWFWLAYSHFTSHMGLHSQDQLKWLEHVWKVAVLDKIHFTLFKNHSMLRVVCKFCMVSQLTKGKMWQNKNGFSMFIVVRTSDFVTVHPRGGGVLPIRGIRGCATWQVWFGKKLPYIRVP